MKDGEPCKMNFDVLCCSGLTKELAGKIVFHNISFTLRQGEIMACTGAGIYALIRVLIGKDTDYAGKLQINGSVGSVFLSDTVQPELTPLQIMQEANVKHETDDILVGMLSISKLDDKRNIPCGKMMSGELRSLLVIREVLKAPDLLILEDIFTGTSTEDQKIIKGMLIEVNAYIAILLTVSSSECVRGLADQVMNLDTGQMELQEDGQHNEFQQQSPHLPAITRSLSKNDFVR